MGNTLKMDKQEVLKRIFGLGWSNRKINRSTGIHRPVQTPRRPRSAAGPEDKACPRRTHETN